MPKAAARPCRYRGCPRVTDDKRGFCEEHRRHQWDEGANGQPRENAYRRGYGRSWRDLREIVLRNEPLCRICQAEGRIVYATQVDHINGDQEDNAMENLQPICVVCHAKKTAKERARGE